MHPSVQRKRRENLTPSKRKWTVHHFANGRLGPCLSYCIANKYPRLEEFICPYLSHCIANRNASDWVKLYRNKHLFDSQFRCLENPKAKGWCQAYNTAKPPALSSANLSAEELELTQGLMRQHESIHEASTSMIPSLPARARFQKAELWGDKPLPKP